MLRFLFSVLLSLPLAVAAVPLFDPAAGVQPFNVNKGDERRQSVVAENGPSGELMLHAMWDCAAADYLEFYFLRPIPMPEFKTGEVTMEAFITEGAPIRAVNFRLVDSQGETFQYTFPADQLKPGKRKLRVQLDRVHKNSWGEAKNGEVDFPAKMQGASIDFSNREGAGELWIGKVEFVSAQSELGELLVDLATARTFIYRGAERQQTATKEEVSGRQTLRLNWDAANAKWIEIFFPPVLMKTIDEFDSVRFSVELLIPENFDGKTVNLRLEDKSGETFQFALPTAGLPPGWNTVSLRVDKSVEPNRGIWGGDGNHTLDFPVQLKGFSVDYPSGSGVGTIGFGKVYLVR